MRLSKKRLRRIIREEMENAILEIGVSGSPKKPRNLEVAYRKYINGLRFKKKVISKEEWQMLRRAIQPGKQYDPTNPEGKAKLDKLLRPYEQKGEKSVASRKTAAGVSMTGLPSQRKRKRMNVGDVDNLKELAKTKPRMNHRNNISDPQLKAKYDAKVQEIAKDKQLNITAKKVAVNPASWLRTQVFKRVNKMVVDGTLG